jgi:uncharacterized protein YhfF
MIKEKHPSIENLCRKFFEQRQSPQKDIPYTYFCDNQKDADECADLVLRGEKQATASLLWWYETKQETMPKVGDLFIVTNWAGEAICVTETTNIDIVPYNEITAAFAELEGEGDKSLEYWKKVHRDFFQRELADQDVSPSETMPIVCETFKVVCVADGKD